jgi:hypothetical protein
LRLPNEVVKGKVVGLQVERSGEFLASRHTCLMPRGLDARIADYYMHSESLASRQVSRSLMIATSSRQSFAATIPNFDNLYAKTPPSFVANKVLSLMRACTQVVGYLWGLKSRAEVN